ALLFDHFRSSTYGRVMGFLHSIEHRGTWADKWDFWPPPSDPYYVWTAADTSVVNISLIYWSLACALGDRPNERRTEWARAVDEDAAGGATDDEDDDGTLDGGIGPTGMGASSRPAGTIAIESVAPSPAPAGCAIRFTVADRAGVSLSIHDAAG